MQMVQHLIRHTVPVSIVPDEPNGPRLCTFPPKGVYVAADPPQPAPHMSLRIYGGEDAHPPNSRPRPACGLYYFPEAVRTRFVLEVGNLASGVDIEG